MTRFLSIHALVVSPPGLLNRDQAGMPKSIRFGGKTRARWSSQFQKRHLLDGLMKRQEYAAHETRRSRYLLHFRVLEPLATELAEACPGVDAAVLRRLVTHAGHLVYATLFRKDKKAEPRADTDAAAATPSDAPPDQSAAAENGGGRRKAPRKSAAERAYEDLVTRLDAPVYDQEDAPLLGRSEMEAMKADIRKIVAGYLAGRDGRPPTAWPETTAGVRAFEAAAQPILNDAKKRFEGAVDDPWIEAGIGAVLSGRMIAESPQRNITAALAMAHALTTHTIEQEEDYFTVRDDHRDQANNAGAAFVGQTMLTTGVFYRFMAIDLDQLTWNCAALSTDTLQSMLADILHEFLRPPAGAKMGSTAAYLTPEFALVEIGPVQPVNGAIAFHTAVPCDNRTLETSIDRLLTLVADNTRLLGAEGRQITRACCTLRRDVAAEVGALLDREPALAGTAATLVIDDLLDWTRTTVAAALAAPDPGTTMAAAPAAPGATA